MAHKHTGNDIGRPISGRQLYQAQKQSERGNTLGFIVLGWVNHQRRLIQRTATMGNVVSQHDSSPASSRDQEDYGDR